MTEIQVRAWVELHDSAHEQKHAPITAGNTSCSYTLATNKCTSAPILHVGSVCLMSRSLESYLMRAGLESAEQADCVGHMQQSDDSPGRIDKLDRPGGPVGQ